MISIARLLTVFGVELSKAARLKQTYAGPFLVFMAVMLGLAAQPIQRGGDSDYGFLAYIVPVALGNLAFALSIVYSACLIAPEAGSGTIRQILVRPIYRSEYVLAKLLIGLTYNALLTASAVLPAWALVYLLGEARGVQIGGELVYTDSDMMSAFLGGLALCMPAQWAGVAFGLMLSALTRSPVTAVSVGIGAWLIADLLKYNIGIEQYLFTTYLEGAWQVFGQRCAGMSAAWTPTAFLAPATGLPVFAICAAAAVAALNRRNMQG